MVIKNHLQYRSSYLRSCFVIPMNFGNWALACVGILLFLRMRHCLISFHGRYCFWIIRHRRASRLFHLFCLPWVAQAPIEFFSHLIVIYQVGSIIEQSKIMGLNYFFHRQIYIHSQRIQNLYRSSIFCMILFQAGKGCLSICSA